MPRRRARPETVDPAAWALARSLPAHVASQARSALIRLAEAGHYTGLDSDYTGDALRALEPTNRSALRRLLRAAEQQGVRACPVPAPLRRRVLPRNYSRERPDGVDPDAWRLTNLLPQQKAQKARAALAALAQAGHSTNPRAIGMLAFSRLGTHRRWALRGLLALAVSHGLRDVPPPPRVSRYELALANGIDPATVAFLRAHHAELAPYSPWLWHWLAACVRRGVPTSLDVDLEDGDAGTLWRELFVAAERDALDDPPTRDRQLIKLRRALRALYRVAARAGERSRPAPPAIAESYDLRGNAVRMRALLPPPDQERLARLEDELWDLARRQQAGEWERHGRWKTTRSASTLKNWRGVVTRLITHARDSGWPCELEAVLTPEHVLDFVKRGHRKDGSKVSPDEPKRRWRDLKGLLHMANGVGLPLMSRDDLDHTERLITEYRGRVNTEGRVRAGSRLKRFTPRVAWICEAVEVLEEELRRATIKYTAGRMSRLQYHEELQLYALGGAGLLGMWRNDTAATVNLLNARRDESGVYKIGGARAKEVTDEHYVEVIFVPKMIDYVTPLLGFEGRSIDQPVRPGEQPHVLRAERAELRDGRRVVLEKGDRWGDDPLMNEDLLVAPLWLRDPGRMAPKSYEQVTRLRREVLRRFGWLDATPHTFRKAGALYWRLQGATLEQVMEIGLWSDHKTLLDVYAAFADSDKLAALAALAPSSMPTNSKESDDLRRAAIIRAQRLLIETIAAREPALPVYEQMERELRRCADAVASVNAAQGGAPQSPRAPGLLTGEEIVRTDEALRPLYAGGLRELLGRDVLSGDRVATRRAATELEPSPRLRRLLERRVGGSA